MAVKSPKGFGKNYFTFSAMLAHTVENSLQAQLSCFNLLTHHQAAQEDDSLEEDPPVELLADLPLVSAKPCHCNCFYKLHTRLILLCNTFIARCPYYTTYFAFRRTGVHPPLSYP